MTHTTAQDIASAHALVWDVRSRIGHLWPCPDVQDALLFALSELGECADAHMRNKLGYNRNSNREHDVQKELADLSMMLLTALPGEWHSAQPHVGDETLAQTFASAAWMLWFALNMQDRPDRWHSAAEVTLHHIAQHVDGTLTDAVRGRLERIERRVMGEVE